MKADQFEGLRYNLAQMKLDGKDRIVLPVEALEALLDACQPPKSCTCQRCELCGNPAPDGYCTNCKRDVHKPGGSP